MPSELSKSLIILFISGFIYIILGIYLYEVIPQQFGVRKSPLFCIEKLINNIKKKLHIKKKKVKSEEEIGKKAL